MKVMEFKTINEIPIGSYFFVIKRYLPDTFSEVKEYIDDDNKHSDEKAERYVELIDEVVDFKLEYESAKLIGVRNDSFVVQTIDGLQEQHNYVFLSKDDMEKYWEQHISECQKERENTIQYIKKNYPQICEEARELAADVIKNKWWWTEEQKQEYLNRY